jgi:class 3 adenylate cyclase
MGVEYRYNSLEDYLTSTRLDVNGLLDDGWGAKFPVKGREIEAAVLFCDISNFSGRTYDLSPVETLIFVNNFFAWITAEALRGRHGIVDKYIGDEIMVLFSAEFGSEDPLLDALQTARFMAEQDSLSFCPHVGIAAGEVVIGYVGTPLKYNCSVFGRPVAVAARCASVKGSGFYSSRIVLPALQWKGRNLDEVFPPRQYRMSDGEIQEQEQGWKVLAPHTVEAKNMPDMEIVEIVNELVHLPSLSVEDRARKAAEALKHEGSYARMRYGFETRKSSKPTGGDA